MTVEYRMSLNQSDAARVAILDQARQVFIYRLVLVYANLWILEGAARKWVPGADLLMYVARDGVLFFGIVLLLLKYPSRDRRDRAATAILAVMGLVAWGSLSALASEASPLVTLVGLRAYIAPFLLIYLVWRNRAFTVWRGITRVVLLYAPIQATLVVAQVVSPLSSPVNRYAGGIEGTFVTSGGVARATGTFSFSEGLTIYATLAVAVALGCILTRLEVVRPGVVWLALVSCIVMVAISGSRGLAFNASVIALGILVGHLRRIDARGFARVAAVAAVGAASWVGIQILLADVLAAFQRRIELAAEAEDPIARLFQGSFGFFLEPFSLVGAGAGVHTQAGIAAGSSSRWIESDNLRTVAELGVVGYVLVCVQVIVGFCILVHAVVNPRRVDSLHTALAVAVGVHLLFGNITGTPTSQGAFGLSVAALLSIKYFERGLKDDVRFNSILGSDDSVPEKQDARCRSSYIERRR